MSEIIGKEIEFGVATEATRGTVEAAADKWVRKVNANVVERAVHAEDETTRGVLEDGEGRRVVQKYAEGSVEGIAHVDVLGWFLSNIYGKVVTSILGNGCYQHIFNLKQSIQHQSLTLFMKDGNVQQLAVANAMINTLELNAAIDQHLRFVASFVGGATTDDTDTPSYDTEFDFIAKDIVVKIADTEAGLSGATAIPCKDLAWTYDQGLIRDHVVGAYTPDDVYNGKLAISGQFTLNLADQTYKDLYLGDTAKYMSITVTGGTYMAGAVYPTITLILNKVQLADWNRSGDASALVTQPISFKAYYNATDSKASQTTLKNMTAAYTNVPSA